MHVDDRWTRPGPAGRRIRTGRWGRGLRWRARWTDPDGTERARACATRDEAEGLLSRVRVDMASGSYVSPQAGRETFRSYAEKWRAHQLHHRPSTAEQAESRLRLHVYPAIGDRPLGAVRRSDVQALVSAAAEVLAPSTVEVVYAYVATVFKAAVEDRLVAHTPCSRISLPEVPRAKVVPLTVVRVLAVREALPDQYRAMVDLCAATGLRGAELRAVTLDRLSPRVHVTGDRPAGTAVRVDRQLTATRGGLPVFGPPKTPAAVPRLGRRALAHRGRGHGAPGAVGVARPAALSRVAADRRRAVGAGRGGPAGA
jgi:integrase